MDVAVAIGLAELLVGLVAVWLGWRHVSELRRTREEARIRGDAIVAFLHGLKTADLPARVIVQIDDMLARFDPPKS
jgi:hypothetical protein